MPNNNFTFEISLSILNHLGRNLYRNFITVLGEAISNSWDADAENVWIYIDRGDNSFVIKDDGDGMTSDDFQNKFLKVGYSKRKSGGMLSPNKRPYIGAKGIGKLALLSCAEKVSVISKTDETDYMGGVIDNSGLTEAIEHDLTPDKYPLGGIDVAIFEEYISDHKTGTVIYFDQIKEDIKNTVPHLKKLIALYFRFSLVDPSFNIFVNEEPVSLDDLKYLSDKTQFLWNINGLDDPYISTLSALRSDPINITNKLNIKGFIATVEKPRYLKISGAEEKVGIDLFVNGRLRERDILKNLPDFSTRHIASYLYGQIHFDELDSDGKDRFGTSREGIIPGDEKYKELIETLKNEILNDLSQKWDELRLEIGEDGDIEIATKERKARSLFNLSSKDYLIEGNSKVDTWVKELRPDAEFNIPAYVDCFLSENLVRKYIPDKSVELTPRATNEIKAYKEKEEERKNDANISFDISQSGDLSYLGMDTLSHMIEGEEKRNEASLSRDAVEYKPMRNAVGHTALLTQVAKERLSLVYENIKSRIKILLS
ncbi:MAG: ATP-binding protein [Candidatus Paceibacterota bacterium]|jgi:hypothetical protein